MYLDHLNLHGASLNRVVVFKVSTDTDCISTMWDHDLKTQSAYCWCFRRRRVELASLPNSNRVHVGKAHHVTIHHCPYVNKERASLCTPMNEQKLATITCKVRNREEDTKSCNKLGS